MQNAAHKILKGAPRRELLYKHRIRVCNNNMYVQYKHSIITRTYLLRHFVVITYLYKFSRVCLKRFI